MIGITGTLFAYFSILIMNFGDYSRYVKSSQELLKGNLSLIISTIIYSFLLLVIVIGADKMSSIIDYTERKNCVLFGDGGGAVLLEPSKDNTGIQDYILKSDGSGGDMLCLKAGGSLRPASSKTIENKEHYIYQEGSSVFKFAVTNMANVSEEIMLKNNLTSNDISYLVPHQANKRIIDATANRMGVGPEKVLLNIEKYGNTTAGTIPLCFWDFEKKFKKGDNLVLAAFGGGFTWGSLYLKWSYNTK